MLKFFTSDIRRNLIKILCLTVGMSIGFLLVAKIYFEQTFDSQFPDIDRTYRLTESVVENGEYKEYDVLPGGLAHELRRQIPGIEKATRFTPMTGNTTIKLEDGRLFDVPAVTLADTCLFDVLPTPIIAGNPHEVLAVTDLAMIPRSLAEKIGGDVVGLTFSNVGWSDDYKMTIGGVYEDYPLNSTIYNELYLSLPSITKIYWGGSDYFIGNDRYQTYAILAEGADPDELHPLILSHLKKIIPEEAFTISNYKVWLRPLKGRHASNEGVKRMSLMLLLLATVMLMCAGLNFLLIVIGQLVKRDKEMAIRKCYGTDRRSLFLRVMSESLFFIVISFGLSLLLSFSLADLCKRLLGATPGELFSTPGIWLIEGFVCVVLLIITGVVPAIIYSRTPVVNAFRPVSHGKKIWKLALLSLQFFATGLIICLLVLVGRQYAMTATLKMGFDYENIGVFSENGMPPERTSTIIEELKKLPCVENVGAALIIFGEVASGNNMWTEGHYENQTNIADMEYITPSIVDVMGLKFVQGGNFSEQADSTVNEIIVEERMIELLQKVFGETDDYIVGKQIYVTGHAASIEQQVPFTIVGVIKNTRRGGLEYDRSERRAGILFPHNKPVGNIYVRFTELTPENLKAAQKVIDSLKEDAVIYITPFKTQIDAKRAPIRGFGIAVMTVGIAILLIALIGLIGYVADEVNRRAKEIAIRKVNGTPAQKIVRLFCIDILRVALPSLIAGGVAAIFIGRSWLSQFTERVDLSPLSMVLALIVLLILIMGVVVLNSLRVARSNPVNHLRSE